MKKVLCGLVTFAVVVVAAILVTQNLPFLSSYVISKIAGGKVVISTVDLAYEDGLVSVDLGGVSIRGKVNGSVNSWKLVFDLRRGLHFNHVVITGFNLKVSDFKCTKKEYYIVPTDLFEARNGIVVFGAEPFAVKELVVEHLKTGKPFHFRMDIQNNEIFGVLKIRGDGVLKGRATIVKGKANVVGMDIGRWTDKMSGVVNGEGSFEAGKGKLSVDGSFQVAKYELKIDELKKHCFDDVMKGNVVVTLGGDKIDVFVKDVCFKDAPFNVRVRFEKADISEVRLSSGELNLEVIKDYVNLDRIVKGGSRVWDYVGGGTVELRELVYSSSRPFRADIKVTGVRSEYKDAVFTDIGGILRFDEKKVDISGLRGHFKESLFQDISATFIFASGRVTAKGAYVVDLRDVASKFDYPDLTLKEGIVEGTMAFERRAGRDLDWSGVGILRNGEVRWRNLPFSTKGIYRFTKDMVTFDSFQIYGGGTDIVAKGTWSKKSMKVSIKGRLDADHVKRISPLPFKAKGTAGVDILIESENDFLKAAGSIDLRNVSYEIKDVMRKEAGIQNTVAIDILKEEKGVLVRRLKYDLEAVDIDLSGDIGADGKMNLHAAMKIDSFEKAARLFYVTDVLAKGKAEMELSMGQVNLKTREIPYIKGYIDVNNGVVRLPWVAKPFTEITLRADFKGEVFDVNIESLRCGSTVLRQGAFHLESLESPRFFLSLNMETFNLGDFKKETEFKLKSLNRDGLLARAKGSASLRAHEAILGGITGENLQIASSLEDRKINFSEFKAGIMGGQADFHGKVDLSGTEPQLHVSGKLKTVTADHIVRAFDPNSQIVQGVGSVLGNVNSRGVTPQDWLRNVDGNVTFYSRNGIIRRWAILSKIFGVLNFYDLLRGKVDLRADGLAYTKMSARFQAKKGVFRTDNFLIDSPSMLITGVGDFDFAGDTVAGNITVSPLVTVDMFIDKLPVIRSILKKEKSGFLYASYDVKGPLGDPEVKLSFADTVVGKSLEIIKNILTLPAGVFE
ncbi:MAG: AsmA-like C-terminal region-containing protein [Syntrophobacterales bacterium]|jgi:hypothetical protein|nr:AsmA-like C-terminal region-containing protein [Syntrophobacterales bacterium]